MFTKENTKQMKGIAILLMLMHHLYTFPNKIPYDCTLQTSFYISGMELTEMVGLFGKICVSIYMFLGGYGLFKRYNERQNQGKEPNQLGKEIWNLYKAYWKVFLIFIPIAFIFFGNQIQYCLEEAACNRYAEWETRTFLNNLMGLRHTYNDEWWFFICYIFALFEGYVFIEWFKNKRNLYIEIAFTMLWTLFLNAIFPILPYKEGYEELWGNFWYSQICLSNAYVVLFFVGIIYAKYDIFERWYQYLTKLRNYEKAFVSLCAIILIVYVRTFFCTIEHDIVIAPVFIFGCYLLTQQIRFLNVPLSFLGKHSTNMWLTHTFFCYYFSIFSKLVYCSNNAIVAFITLLLLSLGSSIGIEFIWKIIAQGYISLASLVKK